jgi:cation:H+ antiporter
LSSYLHQLSLATIALLFIGLTLVIAVAGSRLTRIADRLADATGLGEAIFGAVLLGGVTSTAGIVASVSAAWEGQAELSVSNAIGGIAAQTVFLAVADRFYPKANLEHAAASLENLLIGVLLMALLSWTLLLYAAPPLLLGHVHPGSIVLIALYLGGLRLIAQAKAMPMWRPRQTRQTVADLPEASVIERKTQALLWLKFVVLAVIVGLAGYGVAQTGVRLAAATQLSASFVGALFTAVATSMPELVVAISGARTGALTLAVSNIVGGNAFDVLFVAFADMAYREGSIYAALTERSLFVVGLTLMMTVMLLFGLLFRERYGPGKIGWDGLVLLVVFLGGYAVLALM